MYIYVDYTIIEPDMRIFRFDNREDAEVCSLTTSYYRYVADVWMRV
jgi:hypothetical protein